jgi:hypothetical protein
MPGATLVIEVENVADRREEHLLPLHVCLGMADTAAHVVFDGGRAAGAHGGYHRGRYPAGHAAEDVGCGDGDRLSGKYPRVRSLPRSNPNIAENRVSAARDLSEYYVQSLKDSLQEKFEEVKVGP